MRKQDKKNDDVEVEGQGMTLFEDEEVSDEQRPQYAGHIVGVVHRAPGQLFTGTLGVLRPSSAATKEKQDAERRERDGVDLRANDKSQPIRIVWLRPVDKRVPLLAIPVNEAPADFVENAEKYANRLFCACIKSEQRIHCSNYTDGLVQDGPSLLCIPSVLWSKSLAQSATSRLKLSPSCATAISRLKTSTSRL